jgi:rhodanese-related sulfurtransferase
MKQITPQELKQLLASGEDVLLIDVREPWEHAAFNIGGVLIPLSDLIARASEIQKDKTTVLYCEKGIRSVIAIQRLEMLGFHNLINLAGGMSAWRAML